MNSGNTGRLRKMFFKKGVKDQHRCIVFCFVLFCLKYRVFFSASSSKWLADHIPLYPIFNAYLENVTGSQLLYFNTIFHLKNQASWRKGSSLLEQEN